MASAATSGVSGTDQPPRRKRTGKSLQDPERVEMIRTHRALQSTMAFATNLFGKAKEKEPVFAEKVPKHLKPIKLRQMDPEQEWVFMNKVLYLTLIEDPMLGFTPIHLIGEDENGDATRLFIHEVPHTEKFCKMLCYGQQLAIIHPFMRIALDGQHGIRVDEPKTIVLLGKTNDRCRYCGVQDAPRKCGKCKRSYCSRECQVSDWKDLDHKRICKK